MAIAAIGTDTGGSVRIPAALCGLAGFKPTARRVPRDGVFPLSSTLDSVGPLAPSAACCALVDAVLAGEAPAVPVPMPLRGLRIGVVRDYLCEGLEAPVAAAFEHSLSRLSAAGVHLEDVGFPELRRLPEINRHGGFSGAEAFALHRQWLTSSQAVYDPRVARRIQLAGAMLAGDYVDLLRERQRLIALLGARAWPFDALVAPTVAALAPPLASIERDDDLFGRMNALILRNPSVINFLDGCGLTLPCHRAGEAPVGLMLFGPALSDPRILRVGVSVEPLLAPAPGAA